jgi:hypothetical protein
VIQFCETASCRAGLYGGASCHNSRKSWNPLALGNALAAAAGHYTQTSGSRVRGSQVVMPCCCQGITLH